MRTPERTVLLAFVCAIAILLRAGFVAQTYVKDPLRTDAGQYAQYSHNVVHHGVYSLDEGPDPQPDSFRSPGYPALLAAVRWVAGEDDWYEWARWLQVALGVAMVPLSFLLARTALRDGPALIVAGLVALSPHLVACTGYILTETLCGLLLLLALWFTVRMAEGKGRLAAIAAGVTLAFAALTNEALVLLPLPLLWLLRRRVGWRGMTAFGAAFLLIMGAWTARNQVLVKDPARSGSYRALITLSHGTYPGWVYQSEASRFSAYLEDPEQPSFGTSWSRFREVMAERVRERPLRYLSWYLLEKPYWLWSWSILQGQGDVYVFPVADSLYETQAAANATRLLMKGLHPAILVLLFLGLVRWLWRARTHRVAVDVLGATLVYVTAVYVVFAPWPRYSIPLRPELYLFAVWTAVHVARRCYRSFKRRNAVCCSSRSTTSTNSAVPSS
ncbi:MAG: glycosyltransferase family 39 protein [Planctomycetota bacterium]